MGVYSSPANQHSLPFVESTLSLYECGWPVYPWLSYFEEVLGDGVVTDSQLNATLVQVVPCQSPDTPL